MRKKEGRKLIICLKANMYKASIKDGVAAEDIRTLKKNPTHMPWDGRKQSISGVGCGCSL